MPEPHYTTIFSSTKVPTLSSISDIPYPEADLHFHQLKITTGNLRMNQGFHPEPGQPFKTVAYFDVVVTATVSFAETLKRRDAPAPTIKMLVNVRTVCEMEMEVIIIASREDKDPSIQIVSMDKPDPMSDDWQPTPFAPHYDYEWVKYDPDIEIEPSEETQLNCRVKGDLLYQCGLYFSDIAKTTIDEVVDVITDELCEMTKEKLIQSEDAK